MSLALQAQAQPLPPGYWQRPLAPQGEAPVRWSRIESSLRPQDCGLCHPDKLADWRTSPHAKAFSPGLVGQLLTYNAEDTRSCMACHAPLAEQTQAFETARRQGNAALPSAQGLAAAGNSCGGCHLRQYRHYGPPDRRSNAVGPTPSTDPHGGAIRTKAFESSDFCGACHQFPQNLAINGKPLENTLAEWRASPAARSGKTCQSCHMPERRHLWRGIHDAAMVRSGVQARFSAQPGQAVFRLINSGVGHAFPTYVTPKAVLTGVALDISGHVIAGSEKHIVIQRQVAFTGDVWHEISDSRLLPDQSATLSVPWPPSGRVRFWLEIDPDDFYHRETYPSLRRDLPENSAAARLIAAADARATASPYRLFETELRRP